MWNFLKVKGHRPVRHADHMETAQLQVESWDAAQKFGVQSALVCITLVHDHEHILKNMWN